MLKDKKYSFDLVNTEGLTGSQIMLIHSLSTAIYEGESPEDSVMTHSKLCFHDDGFLCEHRLQYIIDYLRDSV